MRGRCEFIESLERFLLDGRTAKNALPSVPLRCPKCSQDLRLLGIEGNGAGELLTFECTDCGHLEVMGTPAEYRRAWTWPGSNLKLI